MSRDDEPISQYDFEMPSPQDSYRPSRSEEQTSARVKRVSRREMKYSKSEETAPRHNIHILDDHHEEERDGERTKDAPKETTQHKLDSKRSASTKNEESSGKKGNFMNLFSDYKISIFLGVVLLLFAAYSFVSALSFISEGNADQSIVTNNSFSEISSRASEVKNFGGPVGAVISNFLLSKWLGVGSFVVIIYAVILAISLLRLRPCRFWILTFKSLVSAIAVSIIAGALCYSSTHNWYWGGEHGYAVNHFLLTNTGIWGDISVNIILFVALVLMFFDTIMRIFGFVSDNYQRLRANKRVTEVAEEVEEETDNNVHKSSLTKSEKAAFNAEQKVEAEGSVKHPAESEETYRTVFINDDFTLNEPSEKSEKMAQEDKPAREADPGQEAEMNIQVNEIDEAKSISTDSYDPTAELSRYKLPHIGLLREIEQKKVSIDLEEQEANKQRIIDSLNSYGIEISSITATVGPTITLYEIVPAEGIRISKIKNLGQDMALSLSALGIRIIAPMPGKGTIGMEVPNRDKQIVSIRSILSSRAYQESEAALPMAMGTTITNEVYVADLAKMPHVLVAGATGMGKSVGLNTIIASLLYRRHPAELKFVLIDPKMVELSLYSVLENHFLAKLPDEEDAIITDPSKALTTLNSLCIEMDNRYELLRQAGVRDLKGYNAKFIERRLNPEKGHRFLPYIVVVVDEFADLIYTAGREVEGPISRIAAKARAVGIHMILATQRPSVDVITGVIKANFPGRIAFRVNQMTDSRTILDRPGADQLIGRGDMIISKDGVMERVQCALIETEEVEAICSYISKQMGYCGAYELPEYIPESGNNASSDSGGARDTLFEEAGRYIIESGIGSTTAIQRHFNVGFPRAGKIMDQLERAGVVGPTVGGKPRKVLMDLVTFDTTLGN